MSQHQNEDVHHHGHGIIQQILAYVLKNPDARDTLQGITDWWVIRKTKAHKPEEVQQALDWLVAQNLMIKRQIETADALYAMNKDRLADIRKLVKNRATKKEPECRDQDNLKKD